MSARRNSIDEIRFVASRLGPLLDRVVFLGGATVGLLITESGGAPPRPTDDVDLAIDVASKPEYWRLSAELSQLRFQQEMGAGFCRWMLEETPVDIMPADEAILGFSNRWYPATFAQAQRYEFADGLVVRLISAPCFLATKFEALGNRGHEDFIASKDLEDIVSVVDGRPGIVAEVELASADIQAYLAAEISRYLGDDAFCEALSGHLGGDVISQARLPKVIDRLERIGRRTSR